MAISASYLYENDTTDAGNQVLTLGSGVTDQHSRATREITAGELFRRRDRQPGRHQRHNGRRSSDDRGRDFHQHRHDRRHGRRAFDRTAASPTRERSTSPTARRSTCEQNDLHQQRNDQPSMGRARSSFEEALTTAQLGTVNAASGATLDFAGGSRQCRRDLQCRRRRRGRGLDRRRHDRRRDQPDGHRPEPLPCRRPGCDRRGRNRPRDDQRHRRERLLSISTTRRPSTTRRSISATRLATTTISICTNTTSAAPATRC